MHALRLAIVSLFLVPTLVQAAEPDPEIALDRARVWLSDAVNGRVSTLTPTKARGVAFQLDGKLASCNPKKGTATSEKQIAKVEQCLWDTYTKLPGPRGSVTIVDGWKQVTSEQLAGAFDKGAADAAKGAIIGYVEYRSPEATLSMRVWVAVAADDFIQGVWFQSHESDDL